MRVHGAFVRIEQAAEQMRTEAAAPAGAKA